MEKKNIDWGNLGFAYMPTDKRCPKCSDMLLKKKTRNMLVCKNPKCTYKEKTDI